MRRVSADDEYKGYRIPKGAIVFANVWWVASSDSHERRSDILTVNRSILHNSDKYPDPDAFRPERYLEELANTENLKEIVNEDPMKYDFGFGAR